MNKKILFTILVSFFFLSFLTAQHSIVVQNGGASVYKTIDEAYENATNGDTIYLPGGSFNMPLINKSLVWIGVGYHPDSTEATYYTRINNAVSFQGDCDNSVVTGIHFVLNVSVGSTGN